MATDKIITPDQWDEAGREWSERVERHVRRFDDLDAFLSEADIAVQYYFARQSDFSEISAFKAHLKSLLEEYRGFFSLTDYRSLRAAEPRMAEIEETYDEIVYFGIHNPIKSMRERLETDMTIEEQRATPKGLVLRFSEAVRKIF